MLVNWFAICLTSLITALIYGNKCFMPNNYLFYEATRPISDCRYCRRVEGPLILNNMTQDEFQTYVYIPQPIVIKNAVKHWPAMNILNFNYLKKLYERYPIALNEECRFFNFGSDLKTLKDVFAMPQERVNLSSAQQTPWYVGWSNCHPLILEELRKLYPKPHFLPNDAEMSNMDYVFLGYNHDDFMHLDYIPRLMWQAQIQGNKTWILAPTPECDNVCQSFTFYAEPGDAVLIDTRIWYHGTSLPEGEFALTIQSEYG